MEDILAHKLANDIGGIEDVVSCYVLEEGEVIGEEEGKDLKEIAVVQSALIGELCSNYISGRLKFSDYKAIVLKHEDVDIVVFFVKKHLNFQCYPMLETCWLGLRYERRY